MRMNTELLCIKCCTKYKIKFPHSDPSRPFPPIFPWHQEGVSQAFNARLLPVNQCQPSAPINVIQHDTDNRKEVIEKKFLSRQHHVESLVIDALSTNAPTNTEAVYPSPRARGSNVSALVELFEKEIQPESPPPLSPADLPRSKEPSAGKDHDGRSSPQKTPAKAGSPCPDDWSQVDMGDVAMKLKDDERKFSNRQRYRSMFQDAPLYQVYDEVNSESIGTPGSPIAKVIPGAAGRNVNSLEFEDNNFKPIDSDDSTLDTSARSTSPPKHKRRPSSERTISPTRKSPPPVTFDNRLRTAHPGAPITDEDKLSSSKKALVKRSPSDPKEMQAFVDEFAGTGPNRAMWCSMPQVVSLGLAKGLSKEQRKLQEALFEILTSEASYYRSLNVLIESFYKSPYMQPGSPEAVVNHVQKHHLFSNVLDIHMTSENFLCDMEACFREDPWLIRLSEIVYNHAEQRFDTYETYMQNQMFQYRTLETLRKNSRFTAAMKALQGQPECAFLDLASFLILPTQRIPRLCLLLTSVLSHAIKGSLVYRNGLVALASLDKCAREGESKKLYIEQKERLMNLAKQFEYKFDVRTLATDNQRLIKEGELSVLTVQHIAGSTFRKRLSGITRQKSIRASLFVFDGLLLIAKRRRNNRLYVDEYCSLKDVKVEVIPAPSGGVIYRHYPHGTDVSGADDGSSPRKSVFARRASTGSNGVDDRNFALYGFRLIIQSETHPRAEYTLQTETLSERERWIDIIAPPQCAISDDLLIRDCPQVRIVRSYLPVHGDELELKEGDSASLLVSVSDGWCKGMLPGGKKGWFPENVCVEVKDDSVKIENVKKFLVMEEARVAYKRRKTREQFVNSQKLGSHSQ